MPADLSTADGIADLASRIAELEPAVHILVNNAGATWGAPLDEYPDDAWDKVLATNVKAVFGLTVALHAQLSAAATEDDPARVVNIGRSTAYVCRRPTTTPTRPARQRCTWSPASWPIGWRAEHITVNAIAPGPFPSKMMAFILDADGGEEMVGSGVPLGRIGRPDDVAGTVLFLTRAPAAT